MTQCGFFFDQSRCYGCQACATACKDWNDLEPGPAKWMTVYEWETGTFPELRLHALAFSCAHCANPSCMAACEQGAIFKEDKYGAVLVDSDKCVGCRKCKAACPYDAPKFADDEPGTKMSKCTMCIDRLEMGEKPQCALACPMRALDFGPIDELRETYGDVATLDGMPDAGDICPSMTYKPMEVKTNLIPFDVAKVLELNAQREGLPNLYDDIEEVTDIPDGLMFKNGLHMNGATAMEIMRATINDLG
ncbi:MAG: 4Fe-4S dicluster domain-containing protein [Eggerthellales bacterium]|nr:4Fe-4S dicluster domain-containing protein [Eggerthellales bacterium]